MDAKKLFIDKENAYMYLERYVNNGSPSGFTDLRTTSDRTNPFIGEERFPLLEFIDTDIECIILGAKHECFERGVNYGHPDSINSEILIGSGRKIVESHFVASPTAGARTMLIRSPNIRGYLKLTYDVSRIGRVDRQIALKNCQSSLEVSECFKKCIDEKKFPPTFSLLLETSAKISVLELTDKVYQWGVIFREGKPYPYIDKNTQLIPGFSLFGIDRHAKDDEFLINQFIEISKSEPRKYLVNLLKMIVDCYWAVVLNCAFHLECHAQNCLFEIDEEYNINRMVIIDLDSVDKDIPLARYFGFNDKWESFPQACYVENTNNYSTRPSYMYDFKVGEYLLVPLIDVVSKKYNLNVAEVEKEIREYVQMNYTSKLPPFYFPSDGCWYYCENTERKPGEIRKYFPRENPKFR